MKTCLKCGTTTTSLLASGRFGCGNCAVIFSEYIPVVKNRDSQLLADSFAVFLERMQVNPEPWLATLKLIFAGQYIPEASYRVRYSRSLKGRFFNPDPVEKEEIRKYLVSILAGYPGVSPDTAAGKQWRAYFFEEDHIRFESLSYKNIPSPDQNFRKLLSSPLFETGRGGRFINSCPTNCGRGNKLSVLIDLKALILGGEFELALRILPDFIRLKDRTGNGFLDSAHSEAVIYTKNFSNNRKNLFLGVVFALQNMVVLIKKRHQS